MAGNHLWWLVKAAEPFTGWACSTSADYPGTGRQQPTGPREDFSEHEMDADDFAGVVTMSRLNSDRLYKLFYTGISDCLLWPPSHAENTIKREFKGK